MLRTRPTDPSPESVTPLAVPPVSPLQAGRLAPVPALWEFWRRQALPATLLAVAVGLAQCTYSEDSGDPPVPPPADREVWQARLEMHGSASSVIISAPYVQDFTDDQMTRAEGGISIGFLDSCNRTVSRIEAQRLNLSFHDDRVGVAGSVLVQSGDSVLARTDTLVWHSDTDLLEAPSRVRLEFPSGWIEGQNLRTGPGMEEWSLAEPHGVWRTGSESDTGVAELTIRARYATGHQRAGHSEAEYDSIAVQLNGQHMVADRGQYDADGGGRIHLAAGVVMRDSLRALTAEAVEWDLETHTAWASGAVELEETGLHLRADEVREDEDGDQWQARGSPVRVELGDRVLEASILTFQRDEQSLSCQQAVLRDGERVLRADTIEYARDREIARARGKVHLAVPGFRGEATAGDIVLDLAHERVESSQSPALIRSLAEGGTLTIAAGHMVLDLAPRVLTGTGGFSVSSNQTEVVAGRGRFEAETDRVILSHQVEFRQSAASGEQCSRIRSDSMVAELVDGRLSRVGLPIGLEGTVGAQTSRMTWVLADSGAVILEGERLVRLDLTGSGDVTHQNQGRGTTTRFRADAMSLAFDGVDELRRVWASGKAELTSLLASPDSSGSGPTQGPTEGIETRAYNRVQGEELEIDLEDGEVSEVRVLKSIEGRYVPPDAREPSRVGGPREDDHVVDR